MKLSRRLLRIATPLCWIGYHVYDLLVRRHRRQYVQHALLELSNELQCDMDAVSGVHDISRGQGPPRTGRNYDLTLWRSDTLNTEVFGQHGEGRWTVEKWEDANLQASLTTDGGHAIVLDVDMPAELRPSSTPDHYHFIAYPKKTVPWEQMERFMEAAADVGLISRAYLRHCKQRRMSMVRRPGVPKVNFERHFGSDFDPTLENLPDNVIAIGTF